MAHIQLLGMAESKSPEPLEPTQILVKDTLIKSIILDDVFLPLRADALAAHIAALDSPHGVVLYGCGALARALADGHGPTLREAGATFIVTDSPGEASFRGFPLGKAALLPPDTPRVLLLSGSYEAAMRQELAFLPPSAVTTLEEAVCRGCTEALLDKARARIHQEAEGLAAELRERFPDLERTVCFIDPELTMPYLETYARLRGQGHAVVLLSRSHVPSMVPGKEMVARGYADFFHQAPSLHFLWVLAERLCGLVRFGLVNLWGLCYTYPLVNRVLAGSSGPVAVWLDTVLTQVIREEGMREFLLSTQDIDLPRAHQLERTLFARAGGVISRIPPRQLEETRALHASDAPCLTFYRPLLPVGDGRRVRPPLRGRAPRVIFVCSPHTRSDVTSHVAWTLEGIHEPIAALTGQGVEFSIFNPLDVGGGYESLRRAAEENPLLSYSPAIHPEALLEEIAAHDFVWLARKVEPGGSGYHRTHLPLTIFQAVAAGTPVIVSPELAYLGELTLAHNLGFTLPYEDWGAARERMEAFDSQRSVEDIRTFRDTLSPERAAAQLAAFYETVRQRHKAVNGHAPGPR
ncbi:hypothetical protein NNJEOMEG_02789 [Fundidesulfovibrio magnetotacticus]|uniref:Glycosyltransferase n=1 Tax=Fundidesulfovibrio magnetotacticus TaxID=2730080 RepID=A0A6V8LWF8_9BACT|nr:glycosyltransferase [Fundidesulfovibrio magnetotacticus]GFK94941.1 hypothetical protein NNJEOMEG_02789 [Fundidesulfovibrio magnetotacticus]